MGLLLLTKKYKTKRIDKYSNSFFPLFSVGETVNTDVYVNKFDVLVRFSLFQKSLRMGPWSVCVMCYVKPRPFLKYNRI